MLDHNFYVCSNWIEYWGRIMPMGDTGPRGGEDRLAAANGKVEHALTNANPVGRTDDGVHNPADWPAANAPAHRFLLVADFQRMGRLPRILLNQQHFLSRCGSSRGRPPVTPVARCSLSRRFWPSEFRHIDIRFRPPSQLCALFNEAPDGEAPEGVGPMSFADANALFERFLPYLPLLSIPIYLCFVFADRGDRRPACIFSVSVPGVLIPVFVIWSIFSDTPPDKVATIIVFALMIMPSTWVFPLVIAIQLIKIIKGDWKRMSSSSFLFCLFLLSLYYWTDQIIELKYSK